MPFLLLTAPVPVHPRQIPVLCGPQFLHWYPETCCGFSLNPETWKKYLPGSSEARSQSCSLTLTSFLHRVLGLLPGLVCPGLGSSWVQHGMAGLNQACCGVGTDSMDTGIVADTGLLPGSVTRQLWTLANKSRA